MRDGRGAAPIHAWASRLPTSSRASWKLGWNAAEADEPPVKTDAMPPESTCPTAPSCARAPRYLARRFLLRRERLREPREGSQPLCGCFLRSARQTGLGLGWTAHLEQRGPEPVARAERQRSGSSQTRRVFDRDRPLEGGQRGRLIFVAESDLSFSGMPASTPKSFFAGFAPKRPSTCSQPPARARDVVFRGFAGVARPERRVALSKLPDGARQRAGRLRLHVLRMSSKRPNLICAKEDVDQGSSRFSNSHGRP